MNHVTAITIAALAALTPTVTCLIGIILQRSDVRDLRSGVRDLRTDILAMRKDINVEMQAFREDIHDDPILIHERVATSKAAKTAKHTPSTPLRHSLHLYFAGGCAVRS